MEVDVMGSQPAMGICFDFGNRSACTPRSQSASELPFKG